MVLTTSPLVKTYSLQEFWRLPEPADRSKLELIKGVLYMTPPPDPVHSETSASLYELVLIETRRNGYAGKWYTPRAALWIDVDTHIEPDLMYVSTELKAAMGARFTRADIVVEILSPATALYDRSTKSDTYQAMGVREMWLVDTAAKHIEVRAFEAGRTAVYASNAALRSVVLSRIEIPVDSVFE